MSITALSRTICDGKWIHGVLEDKWIFNVQSEEMIIAAFNRTKNDVN
jgi:hypothetical protein